LSGASTGIPGVAKCITNPSGTKIRNLGAKFKFGQLILIKTKLLPPDVIWRAEPQTPLEELSAPPDLIPGFKGSYF